LKVWELASSLETLLSGSLASPKCSASAMQALTQAGVARGSTPGVRSFSRPKSMRSAHQVHFCATPSRAGSSRSASFFILAPA
jgi:hypothetical protein